MLPLSENDKNKQQNKQTTQRINYNNDKNDRKMTPLPVLLPPKRNQSDEAGVIAFKEAVPAHSR